MNLEISNANGYVLAQVSGELNAQSAPEFADALLEYALGEEAQLVIDLSNLKAIDSTGLSVLINLAARSRMSSGRLLLANPTPLIQGVLEVSRLNQFFDIYDTVADADQAMQNA